MTRKRILVVEDEGIVAADIGARLAELGYEPVALAGSGEEALRLSLELRPDLVLMDIRLRGGLDGVETADRIRAETRLPVVFLTAYSDAGTLARAARAEPLGYVVKPFADRELRSAIEVALYQHQAEQERRLLEAQLQQAQRMESLVALAGGVAHDLNNTLAAVLLQSELARAQVPDGSPLLQDLRDIRSGVLRAAGLVGQLLTFAGRGHAAAEPVEIGSLARAAAESLRAELPWRCALRLEVEPDLPRAQADPAQIRQVISHLVQNGADAIGEGRGTISLRVRTLRCERPDGAATLCARLPEGLYVALEVEDDGAGMSEAVRARACEPFFTTRTGRRGLGLAVALGVARARGGDLRIETAPGQGARVTLLLPALEERGEV